MSPSSNLPDVAVTEYDTEESTAEESSTEGPYSGLRDPVFPTSAYGLLAPGVLYSVNLRDDKGRTVGCFDGTRPFTLQIAGERKTNKLPDFEVISTIRGYLKDRCDDYVYEKPNQPKVTDNNRRASHEENRRRTPVPYVSPYSSDEYGADDYDNVHGRNNDDGSAWERAVSIDLNRDKNMEGTPTHLEDINIERVESTQLIIHSQHLLEMIQSVVTYYPQQALTGNRVVIQKPFHALLHHYAQLRKLVSVTPEERANNAWRSRSSTSPLSADERPPQAYTFAALMDFLKPTYESHILTAEMMMKLPNPAITFDLLWCLFKPGEDVYVASHVPVGYGTVTTFCAVVYKTLASQPPPRRPGDLPGPRPGARKYFDVDWWCLGSDGDEVGRWSSGTDINAFDGERDVTSLPIFPTKYLDSQDKGARKKELIEMGKMSYEILRAGCKEMMADGGATVLKKSTPAGDPLDYRFDAPNYRSSRDLPEELQKFQGRVLIDVTAAALHSTMNNPYTRVSVDDHVRYVNDQESSTEQNAEESAAKRAQPWKAYEKIKISSVTELTEHQNLLMFPCLPGYALGRKEWMAFDLSGLSKIHRVEKPLENVIIEDDHFRVIRALSNQSKSSWGADFVRGKGAGQIILLHGPPGVGKTYTVECIAEHFKRPLMVLTIADIGLDESRVEQQLDRNFILAERWNAIILIDEADIFLEQRKAADIARNGLVSAFLRKTEYFSGLLFLTTNRVGQVDDAFISRVHVVIQYPELTETSRNKIWDGFLKKLHNERRGKIIVGPSAVRYVKTDPEINKLAWNGREIRNALQTAIALADFTGEDEDERGDEPVIVEEDNFRKVMEMSRNFKKYLFDIRKADERNRATARKDRAFELLSEFELQTKEGG